MEQEVTRLISASKQDFEKMNGRDLKRLFFNQKVE